MAAHTIEILTADIATEQSLPLSNNTVSAGFPSPAEEHRPNSLDLNKALIKHPSATFFVRVSGQSMQGDGIDNGDLLVVDRAITPSNNCVAVCYLDGEFTLKRVQINNKKIVLMPSNPDYKPITVNPDDDFTVWGVVSYVIKKM